MRWSSVWLVFSDKAKRVSLLVLLLLLLLDLEFAGLMGLFSFGANTFRQQKTAGVAGGCLGVLASSDLRVCLSSRQAVREPKIRKVKRRRGTHGRECSTAQITRS
jgi:hypothetical protein